MIWGLGQEEKSEKDILNEKVKRYFDGDKTISTTGEWTCSFEKDKDGDHLYKGGIAASGKLKSVNFSFYVLDRGLLCQTSAPVGVPEEYRQKMYELLSHCNMTTVNGAFILDPRDGELLFKAFTEGIGASKIEGTDFGDKIMDPLLLGSMSTWNRYGDAFMSLIFGFADDISAEELYEKCVK